MNLTATRPTGNNPFQTFKKMGVRSTSIYSTIIVIALIAFEAVNYSTTAYALRDLLGDLQFTGVRWSTMLALAFCSLDFAGIASLVTQKGQAEKDKESWFLFAAWLIAAAFNAALTWWGVSIAISNHPLRSAEVLNTQNLTTIVPVLVAIMVWVIRVLIIGSLTSSLDKSSRAQRSAAKRTRTTIPAGYAVNTHPTSGYNRPQPVTPSAHAMNPRSTPTSMARPAPKPYNQPVNTNDFITAESQGSRHL